MIKMGKHYGDIKIWIEKVIDSCETMEHIKVARRLISNFSEQLERKCVAEYWREYYYSIIRPLSLLLSDKVDKILEKKLKS